MKLCVITNPTETDLKLIILNPYEVESFAETKCTKHQHLNKLNFEKHKFNISSIYISTYETEEKFIVISRDRIKKHKNI